nr:MAG: hypothetical protein H3Bulk42508_000003 [Mitovirus sp.]
MYPITAIPLHWAYLCFVGPPASLGQGRNDPPIGQYSMKKGFRPTSLENERAA